MLLPPPLGPRVYTLTLHAKRPAKVSRRTSVWLSGFLITAVCSNESALQVTVYHTRERANRNIDSQVLMYSLFSLRCCLALFHLANVGIVCRQRKDPPAFVCDTVYVINFNVQYVFCRNEEFCVLCRSVVAVHVFT